MSDATIFPFAGQPGANHGFGDSPFQHASLDPDASARLAAMDRTLADDAISPSPAIASNVPEVESAQIEAAGMELSPSEPVEIVANESVAQEVVVDDEISPERVAEEISLIETITAGESDLNSESEAAAPALLEVAPILDASGELQPDADQYTPPTPFEIHVPRALIADEIPLVASTGADVTENIADRNDLSETFDLDSICAPTESEQLLEHAIAQEDAVAEMSAAAEEFVAGQIAAPPLSPLASAARALNADPAADRRRKRRALISSPIRVRGIHVTTSGPDEITTTVDVSRYGILFHTVLDTYQRGMDVAVVFPYHKSATGAQAEQFGRVVRLHDMPDGRHAVAIALGVGAGEHLVDSNGRQLANEPVQLSHSTAPQVKRPMVLAVDSDTMLRDTMKLYLQNEGYEVIAVSTATDAREVLNMFMPAMVVVEMEGEGDALPGLDLCAHIKSSPSLKHLPVVVTSRSAYPSDYSNAHSLGAVVCMAKPYKMERLGHIVRLIAPLPEHLQPVCTQRPPDPTRGFGRDCNVAQRGNTGSRNSAKKSNGNTNGNGKSRFKFPSFR